MKAVVVPKYESPKVLQISEIDAPIPKVDEVKVKIIAASLNATDFEIVRGYFIIRNRELFKINVIARKSAFAYKRALKVGGSYRMVGGSTRKIFSVLILGSLISVLSSKKIGLMMGRPNKKEDMEILTELFEAKKVLPIIHKKYSLDEVVEALKFLEDGEAISKLIISME